ncbi:uncharacterized protein LOC108907058 [Anoplophora glabripennis]|uniref:uncharacterized protein LOC108907058 n=1 Tax=Anoplophora glabripennis TaxID=217634 RepID=UPI00087485AB|nr:uncharacterized protein LOC108907058 [Anoplophora glabripennis]
MERIYNKTTEFNYSDGNTSIISNDVFNTGSPVVPLWVVYSYFIFVCLGAAINLIHFLALVRCRKSGALTLIMQLCMVDFLSPYVVVLEILTLNNQIWIFSLDNCTIFNGIEVLVNSLVVWLIICLNFQVISIWNLYRNEVEKKNANPLTSCQDESNECLVTKKENANRTLNIDYQKRKNDISVIVPVILIIFACFSLSIPNFALSSTLPVNGNHTICVIMDHFYGHTLQKALFMFRILVPVALQILTLIILIVKLVQTSPKDIDNILIQKAIEIRGLLLCSIAVTMFYIATSYQRNLLHFLHIMSHNFDNSTGKVFKVPPFFNDKLSSSGGVYLSMLHYCGITCRAFLYIFALPKFQNLVKSKIFVCCKTEKK